MTTKTEVSMTQLKQEMKDLIAAYEKSRISGRLKRRIASNYELVIDRETWPKREFRVYTLKSCGQTTTIFRRKSLLQALRDAKDIDGNNWDDKIEYR